MRKIILGTLIFLACTILGNPKKDTADTFFKAKKYKEALAQYNLYLTDEPNDTDGLYGKALSHFRLDQHSDSIKTFETLFKIDSAYRDSQYRYAMALRKIGKYNEAIEAYERYLKQASDDPDTFYGIAQTYLLLEKTPQAAYYYGVYAEKEKRESEKKWVEKAIQKRDELISNFNDSQKEEYQILLSGKKSETLTTTSIIKKDEQNSDVTSTTNLNSQNSANTTTQNSNNNSTTDNSIALNNNTEQSSFVIDATKNKKKERSEDATLSYMFQKGNSIDDFFLSKNYKEAIEGYKTLLSNPLTRREGLFKTAICYLSLENYPFAIKHFTQIFVEESDNNRTRELLKIFLSNHLIVESLLSKNIPEKSELAMKKVEEFIKKGNYLEALSILDILLENMKMNTRALLQKIDILRVLGKNAEIEQLFKSYTSQYPEDTVVWERYADYLVSANKNVQDAKLYYEKVLSATKNPFVTKRVEKKLLNFSKQ
ncbi:tetratricopeptide repeat protein [bacterium]|nr:tetratricopeptide repeat protein [bacterium]